ncbi:acyltransferase family protein [Arthrobacter crystallopoietes]|uniref:acyltransferase family protein n=1 Tax=Crystallibacter crystallopoietes TaxID=37928 RepID=UPI001ABE8B38|nr:acyltransferase [Arthrobacter crystallopoietes]
MTSAKRRDSSLGRVTSLDGLRGVAAVMVLLSHLMLLGPWISTVALDKSLAGPVWSWPWWLVHTPLHIFWEGTGAVYIFFILSGFVLTLPVVRNTRFSWLAYYPSRIVRLYVPVIASVVLAVVSIMLVPRSGSVGSKWLDGHIVSPTIPAILEDMTLLLGGGVLNTPLWSLRWEVAFSILLPAFVWLAFRLRGRPWILICGCLIAICVGELTHVSVLRFFPYFLIGGVMAAGWETISKSVTRINENRRASSAWLAIAILGVVLLEAGWYGVAIGIRSELLPIGNALSAMGAVLLVFSAVGAPFMKRWLESAVIQWLGKISFSLYLTHEPLLTAIAFLLPAQPVLIAMLTFPLALLLAQIFLVLVERPSHLLARSIKKSIEKSRLVSV